MILILLFTTIHDIIILHQITTLAANQPYQIIFPPSDIKLSFVGALVIIIVLHSLAFMYV